MSDLLRIGLIGWGTVGSALGALVESGPLPLELRARRGPRPKACRPPRRRRPRRAGRSVGRRHRGRAGGRAGGSARLGARHARSRSPVRHRQQGAARDAWGRAGRARRAARGGAPRQRERRRWHADDRDRAAPGRNRVDRADPRRGQRHHHLHPLGNGRGSLHTTRHCAKRRRRATRRRIRASTSTAATPRRSWRSLPRSPGVAGSPRPMWSPRGSRA